MACEHDGNCFSGCCSLFVSGDAKRCMPLVNGDLCPIAIDVVDKLQELDDRSFERYEDDQEEIFEGEEEEEEAEMDSPLHFVDHKEESFDDDYNVEDSDEDHLIMEKTEFPVDEDHPIIEKTEYPVDEEYEIEDGDRVIPVKRERYEDPLVEGDHYIPSKTEHIDHDVHELPKELWNPHFHGHEGIAESHEETHHKTDHSFGHHYGHADGIEGFEEEENTGKLKPKEFSKDDPRFKQPKKAADHKIVPKEPIQDEDEEGPKYGQAYEHERKQAIRGQ